MSATIFDEEEAVALVINQFAEANDTLNPHQHEHETTRLVSRGRSSSSQFTYNSTDATPRSTESQTLLPEEDDYEEDDDDSTDLKPEFAKLPRSLRPSYKLLRLALLIQIIGVMSAVTSMLDAIVYLVCQDHFKNSEPGGISAGDGPFWLTSGGSQQGFQDPRCFAPDVSALVGIFQTYMSTITAILGVVAIPFLATCSDRVGRRPVLIWTMSCGVLSLMITLTCCVFPDKVNYKLFLVSSVLDGFGGSITGILVLCASYTSDVVKTKHRAGVMSVLDAFMFGGIAVGPMIGSAILSYTDHNLLLLFSVSMVCQLIALGIIVFILPESRSQEARDKSQDEHLVRRKSFLSEQRRRLSTNVEHWDDETYVPEFSFIEKAREIVHHVNVLGPLKALNFSHIPERHARFNAIILVVAQSTLSELIMASIQFVFLYAKTRFGWTSVENGYFISLLGASRFIVLSTLLPLALKFGRHHFTQNPERVDVIDKRFLQIGLCFSIFGYFLLAESPTGSSFMASVLVVALGSGSTPLLRNAIIKHSPEHQVGQVLGATTLLARLGNIFLPAIFATVYNYTVRHRAQAIVEVIAATELAVLGLISLMYVNVPTIEDVESMVDDTQ